MKPLDFDATKELSAKNLYEAYNAGGDPATANKNYQGLPCPEWDALPENVRAKWQAVEAADRGSFGWALRRLEAGGSVARRGWNGEGMYLKLQRPDDHSKMGHPYIYMKSADGRLFPWNPNNLDLLTRDWEAVK